MNAFDRMAAAYGALTECSAFCEDCGTYIAFGRVCPCMKERARQQCPVCTERVPECTCIKCDNCGDKIAAEDAVESTTEWQCGIHVKVKLCQECAS